MALEYVIYIMRVPGQSKNIYILFINLGWYLEFRVELYCTPNEIHRKHCSSGIIR